MFDGGRAGLEQVRMEWYNQLLAQFKTCISTQMLGGSGGMPPMKCF